MGGAMFPPARGGGAAGAGDTARGRAGRSAWAAPPPPPRGAAGKDVGGGAQEAVSQSQPGKGSGSRARSGGRAPEGALLLTGGSPRARSRPPAAKAQPVARPSLLGGGIALWHLRVSFSFAAGSCLLSVPPSLLWSSLLERVACFLLLLGAFSY